MEKKSAVANQKLKMCGQCQVRTDVRTDQHLQYINISTVIFNDSRRHDDAPPSKSTMIKVAL
jgi:hypothetical protein